MKVQGHNLIGDRFEEGEGGTFRAQNARTSESFGPPFNDASEDQVRRACFLAAEAFVEFRATSPRDRAEVLDAVADALDANEEAIVEMADRETALGSARLRGELGRTSGQWRLFAELVRDGSWVDARIDRGSPELRRMRIPIGPVAVFGASNFPLAFSVAGGDTASALAAGCPVVVKAHPAHPGTSELVARTVLSALNAHGMPNGLFSLVHGKETTVSRWLVTAPQIRAVGFTGSHTAGRALFEAASQRPQPIPVFAEMGSVNPVFLLPGALATRATEIADGYAESLTLGAGQFCTNPGVVVAPAGADVDRFAERVRERLAEAAPATMLHDGIRESYRRGVRRRSRLSGVATLTQERREGDVPVAEAAFFRCDAATFASSAPLREEVFGPAGVLVVVRDDAEMLEVARDLEGQLTATLHAAPGELEERGELVEVLLDRVGRLLFGGFPTGVRVGSAMHHGGPYPATTDARFTSVGSAAIERFVRPVCYQDAPEAVLPPELRDANPLGISRMVDGRRERSE